MELAGLVYGTPGTDPGRTAGGGRPSASPGPAAATYDDPGEPPPYPAPGVRRYVRFHTDGDTGPCRPEWRLGWAWGERPEDGWVECGLIGVGAGMVPLGRGRPPEVCEWLPAEWPAAEFPLGGTAEHLAGWRRFVLGVFDDGSSAASPDHREYGWRTLARATRALAHYHGAVTLDRVVEPLPGSRDEARREAEPLLDGLVARSRSNRRPDRETLTRSMWDSSTTPNTGDAGMAGGRQLSQRVASDVEQLLGEMSDGYADRSLKFTLIAIPSQAGTDGGGARMQRCDEDSPDAGEIRDGVFC